MGTDIAARIAQTEEKIEAACRRSGRSRREVGLMAVTKFQPPQALEAAWQAGIRLFGESRVQEAAGKFGALWESRAREGGRLHLIGSLQRNKAKTAAALFDCIQSVDRDSLIETLGGLTIGRESPLMILLEYHTAEATKSGFPSRDSLFRAAEKAISFPGLKPAGLMTMAPFTDDTAAVRSAFRELAAVRDELARRFPTEDWNCLSMGMTGDFEIAIEEGSTMIRIGTALFGEQGA
ncbi:MAG: YggS family pyridoxal phosphate-dependent enzyme [Treponema sp.]|nr:YggS family pyridoxal phosphate-dependent enzyme [Treponema sp.]